MNRVAAIKSFAMTNMLLEAELDQIEQKFQIDLGRHRVQGSDIEDAYFPQFDATLRAEAKKMSEHYVVFYCLEKSIRQLIVDVFEATGDVSWWDNLVPEAVKQNAQKSVKREKEAAVTPRSTDLIDYTTFGELARIFHHKRSAEPISPYNMSVEVKSQRGFRRCQSVPQIGSILDDLAGE